MKTLWKCVALTAAAAFGLVCFEAGRDRFDRAIWVAAKQGDLRVRQDMVPSLLRGHRLEGMSRSATVKLLGPPDLSERPGHPFSAVYELGMEQGPFGLDDRYFGLIFNDLDVCMGASAVTD